MSELAVRDLKLSIDLIKYKTLNIPVVDETTAYFKF